MISWSIKMTLQQTWRMETWYMCARVWVWISLMIYSIADCIQSCHDSMCHLVWLNSQWSCSMDLHVSVLLLLFQWNSAFELEINNHHCWMHANNGKCAVYRLLYKSRLCRADGICKNGSFARALSVIAMQRFTLSLLHW